MCVCVSLSLLPDGCIVAEALPSGSYLVAALHLSQPYCPATPCCSSAGRGRKKIAAAANKREEEGHLGREKQDVAASPPPFHHIGPAHPSFYSHQADESPSSFFFHIANEYFLVSAPAKVLTAHTYTAVRLRIRSLPAPEPGFTHQRAAVVNSCLTIHSACVGFERINMFGLVSAVVKKRRKKKKAKACSSVK